MIIVSTLLICNNKYISLEYPMQHFTMQQFCLGFSVLNTASIFVFSLNTKQSKHEISLIYYNTYSAQLMFYGEINTFFLHIGQNLMNLFYQNVSCLKVKDCKIL